MDNNTERVMKKLPEHIQQAFYRLSPEITGGFEEVRIKAGCDTLIISGGREINLKDHSVVTGELLEEILNRLLDYSYYAHEDELAGGYITIEGGHRVGICGRVILENGMVRLIKDISSINIRRGRQIIGVSDRIMDRIWDLKSGTVRNTLIISPPKCGKTTLLRDIARNLSVAGFRVGICDERSEIAGCCHGISPYELGMRTDILDGCPKSEGIMMLIRAMSPDVIIADEIGRKEDVTAVEAALCAGVAVITSIHGSSISDIADSAIGELIYRKVFETLIFLSGFPKTGTVKQIMQLSEERIDDV